MAASLASGLYGIKNKLSLKIEETLGNGYKNKSNGILPASLAEATDKMAKSTVAKELFGEAFVTHFIQTREWEWRKSQGQNDIWELKRFFEII